MALIVVESPTKARTFNRILKSQEMGDYFVFATMGHIRDLPAKTISIDYKNNFEPTYEINPKKAAVVAKLQELAKDSNEIILATDPDREGESISYHVAYILGYIQEKWPDLAFKEGKSLKRIVFHEITPTALKEALDNPETLRLPLVKAQQARRILDRVVGYELSPLLWNKMGKNWLSAGRVQSVALRIIVEREKEIEKFTKEVYFQIQGIFKNGQEFTAKLIRKNDLVYQQTYTLDLFAGTYTYTNTSIKPPDVEALVQDITDDTFTISDVKETEIKRYPPPPYTTSLLQQDGFIRHNFSSKQTMRLAQDLYERGLITYHRTDSFNLSTQFVFRAKDYIEATYGKEYALEKPRGYRTKSKMAQEAHEAIRPTKLDNTVDKIFDNEKLTQNHKKLYKMVFDRAVATQMKEADIQIMKIYIQGTKGYVFESEYQKVVFDGFLKILNPDFAVKNSVTPHVETGTPLQLSTLTPNELATKPPPRYNDASLIKIMEEKGIGRPSTYAPILSLIETKYYVEREWRNFIPTHLGKAISDYLSKAFPDLFSLDFTAGMEESLDQIAAQEKEMVQVLADFYTPFEKVLEEQKKDKEVINIEDDINETCPKCNGKLTVRFSKYGKFYACSNYPACKYIKPFLTILKDKFCPVCSGKIAVRYTRSKKRFYGCENYPKCTYSVWVMKDIGKIIEKKPKKIEIPKKEVKKKVVKSKKGKKK
ncbi:MAG: type I DNA topoisomerase [bacterium]|nr:type I DNA topoisomerase [bacterium]